MPPVSALPFVTPLTPSTPQGAPADAGAWFPAAPLVAAAATGERLSEALVALDGQGRLLDDLLAACAVGAATLPPALLAAVRTARAAVAAVHDAGAGALG